ncbi:MAG TPA: hypothetical protein VMW38_26170 [Terriglobia bacterium]|nr:hypothetical protein [Terriglobia bacterium]
MMTINTNLAIEGYSLIVDKRTEKAFYAAESNRKFHRLADQWRSERRATSLVVDMAVHPAYQSIIGMGPTAVPLILHELRRSPDHWFWALRSITGENPVPEESRGNMREMAEAWLTWGAAKGYVD